MANIKTVVFDKTGTMTCGVFEVSGVHHNTLENSKIIEYAALAESYSGHPISKSLQQAYGKTPDKSRVTNVSEIGGRGVTAEVDGIPVALGNTKLMDELKIPYRDCHCARYSRTCRYKLRIRRAYPDFRRYKNRTLNRLSGS